MWLGRVTGSVWATVKHPPTETARLLIVRPLEGGGPEVAALDTLGAGVKDVVMVITSYEATLPWRDLHPAADVVGLDAAIVGIVDPDESQEFTA